MIDLQVRPMVVPQAGVVLFTGQHPEYFTTLTGGGPEEMEDIARVHEVFLTGQNTVILDFLPGIADRLVKPITAKISYRDGEFLAEFSEAEMVTSGNTSAEAIEWLRDTIVSLYEHYNNERAALGPLPRRQLAVLEAYIGAEQSTEA